MKKAIQIGYDGLFRDKCRYAAEAGFDGISVNYTQVLGKSEAEWDLITDDIGNILSDLGLACYQSHPHYYDLLLSSEIRDEDMEFAMRMSIKSSAKLGAEYCVFHPRTSISSGWRRSVSFEDNKKWFGELLECAKSYGTGIAAENLPIFPDTKFIMPFYSSDCGDLAELVDYFNDGDMAVCWDFGHANLLRADQSVAIGYLGNRIRCTHVHNNFGTRDDHATPDAGNIDWTKVMRALSDTGYGGALTLEVHCLYPDPEMLRAFAKYNYAGLEYLDGLASAK